MRRPALLQPDEVRLAADALGFREKARKIVQEILLERKTQATVAKENNVSRGYACQLAKKALRQIQHDRQGTKEITLVVPINPSPHQG